MICSGCGYMMGAFDKECARCARLRDPGANTQQPATRSASQQGPRPQPGADQLGGSEGDSDGDSDGDSEHPPEGRPVPDGKRVHSGSKVKAAVGVAALAGLGAIFMAMGAPKEGDIYENLLTGQRIKIRWIGRGSDLKARCDGLNEWNREVTADPGLLADLDMHPILLEGDADRRCFAYEDRNEDTEALFRRRITYIRIRPIEDLEDYRRIN